MQIKCMCQPIENSQELACECELPEELLESRKAKKKRAPSKYNIFMGECVKKPKEGLDHKEKFRACATEYKASK